MKTQICIDRLKVFGRHGVFEEELVHGNVFEVSVRVDYDFMAAAMTDDVDKTLNYAELTEMVVGIMGTPCKLLESVAVEIWQSIVERWPEVLGGRVEIAKLHPPMPHPAPVASVVVEW